MLYVYNSREKHRINIMGFLTDIKENKKDRILFIFQQRKKRYIKINGARNYQMRKTTIRK